MSDTCPSDKEGKVMESSEVKEEEESSSFSSPSSMADADTEASDKMPLAISEEESADSSSKQQKHDQGPGNADPEQNYGFASSLVGQLAQLEQLRAALANRADEELPEPPGDIFLFETEINNSNRLLIPTGRAKQHFPRFYRGGSTKPKILHLIIPQVKEWHMPVMHCSDEDAFMFTRLWLQFVKFHNLKPLDKIRFYKPVPRLHTRHYTVAFWRTAGNIAQIPEFRTKNYLFGLEMTAGDVGYKRLFIHNDDVTNHFPSFHIPIKTRTTDMIKLTDVQNKDWYMDVIRYSPDFYMIIEEWDEFVKERNLKAKDVIKFYRPVQPSHRKHFLIEIVRRTA
ncbi:uncharacterized protein LOC130791095 [Actinidia eriantha]|uniref:uncharacterized protein LOC130791095 n=1 Tax=Actinidia eriantha TaxID=165200 RepID=UPI00258ABDD5|nr:uncharacterized protein LOC130791095 [Actinidia eriantha]